MNLSREKTYHVWIHQQAVSDLPQCPTILPVPPAAPSQASRYQHPCKIKHQYLKVFKLSWESELVRLHLGGVVLHTWCQSLLGQTRHVHLSLPVSSSTAYAPSATPWGGRQHVLKFEHGMRMHTHVRTTQLIRLHWLVALVLEVFTVAVIQQQGVRVVLADPLHFLNIKCALGLYPLTLPASRDRDRQA